jgi:hypothetical protein
VLPLVTFESDVANAPVVAKSQTELVVVERFTGSPAEEVTEMWVDFTRTI